MTNQTITAKIIIIALLVVSSFIIFGVSSMADNETKKEESPCAGRQWESSREQLACKYPYPPLGRWKAVYTKEFAEARNLPPENISTDFSSGVDYMEMEVIPFGKGGTACLVSMLIKKPHDVALYSSDKILPGLPEDRRLMRFIDLDQYKDKIKPITSFSHASRDYTLRKKGFQVSTFAIYAEDVFPGYDYIAANASCRWLSLSPQYFPDGLAFWVNKASVWGQYERLYKHMDAPGRPKSDKDFQSSHFFINIPYELISVIFKDVPRGGR